MGVTERSEHENEEVISSIFLVKKPDGLSRMILNLKQFNDSVEYQHFQNGKPHFSHTNDEKRLFLASVDLRHAYYTVPIKAE